MIDNHFSPTIKGIQIATNYCIRMLIILVGSLFVTKTHSQNPYLDFKNLKDNNILTYKGIFFDNQSLKYSLSYLKSYRIDHKANEKTSPYFIDATNTYSYMIFAKKNDESYSLSDQKYYLSKFFANDRAESSKSSLVSHNVTIIDAKKAAVITLHSSRGNQIFDYRKTFFIVCKDYTFQIMFSLGYKSDSPNGAIEEIEKKYEPIFEMISKSVKIDCDCEFSSEQNQKIITNKEKIENNKNSGYWLGNNYYNDLYSFYVSFPIGLEYDNGIAPSTIARAVDRPNQSVYAINTSIYNKIPKVSIEQMKDFYSSLIKSTIPGVSVINAKDGWLNNKPAIIYEFYSLEKSGDRIEEYFHKQIVCLHNDVIISITNNLPKSNWDYLASLKFNRLIGSFKFNF